MFNIAIFASGSGTNAERLIKYYSGDKKVNIAIIYCNNKKAFVIERAKQNNVPVKIINNEYLCSSQIINDLQSKSIDLIVLAGFLLLIPEKLINEFKNKIINLHPALLPKFGGKGMYGANVHNAVLVANEEESGITIHYVDNVYDNGEIILQAKCSINKNETIESLTNKIHLLEYEYLPKAVDHIIMNMKC